MIVHIGRLVRNKVFNDQSADFLGYCICGLDWSAFDFAILVSYLAGIRENWALYFASHHFFG